MPSRIIWFLNRASSVWFPECLGPYDDPSGLEFDIVPLEINKFSYAHAGEQQSGRLSFLTSDIGTLGGAGASPKI